MVSQSNHEPCRTHFHPSVAPHRGMKTRNGLRHRPFSSRRIIYSLNQLHYEGQQASFAQVAKGLEERVSYGERLIGIYNRDPGKA